MVLGSEKTLDKIGWNILRELQIDARLSYAELGRRVGLTTPAVIERVKRMEEANIIAGYSATINHSAVGLPILAFIRMNIVGVDFSQVIKTAENSPEVLECHRGTGGDSFIFKVAAADVAHLQIIIDKFTPFGVTTTSIVLSSPVNKRIIEQKK